MNSTEKEILALCQDVQFYMNNKNNNRAIEVVKYYIAQLETENQMLVDRINELER